MYLLVARVCFIPCVLPGWCGEEKDRSTRFLTVSVSRGGKSEGVARFKLLLVTVLLQVLCRCCSGAGFLLSQQVPLWKQLLWREL